MTKTTKLIIVGFAVVTIWSYFIVHLFAGESLALADYLDVIESEYAIVQVGERYEPYHYYSLLRNGALVVPNVAYLPGAPVITQSVVPRILASQNNKVALIWVTDEPGAFGKVFVLDSTDLESGWRAMPLLTANIREYQSPSKTRIIGVSADRDAVMMLDFRNDVSVKPIYRRERIAETFIRPDYGTGVDVLQARWVKEGTVEVRVYSRSEVNSINFNLRSTFPNPLRYEYIDLN